MRLGQCIEEIFLIVEKTVKLSAGMHDRLALYIGHLTK